MNAWVWVRTQSGSWQVNRDYAGSGWVGRLDVPRELMKPPAEAVRKHKPTRVNDVVRAVFPEFPARAMVIKRYRYRSAWQSLKEFCRRSRARRSFERAYELLGKGIATATPIAAGAIRRFGWPVESYYLSELVPEARSLRQVREEEGGKAMALRVAQGLGKLLGQLHEAGLSHSDPSLSNFLVQLDEAGSVEMVAIDLDALRAVGEVSIGRVVRDLRHLLDRVGMSGEECQWVVEEYCRVRGGKLEVGVLQERLGLKVA